MNFLTAGRAQILPDRVGVPTGAPGWFMNHWA